MSVRRDHRATSSLPFTEATARETGSQDARAPVVRVGHAAALTGEMSFVLRAVSSATQSVSLLTEDE
jgi:hypothetical protein